MQLRQWDIWFAELRAGVKGEQKGPHHVLILSSELVHSQTGVALVAPITTTGSTMPWVVRVERQDSGLRFTSYIVPPGDVAQHEPREIQDVSQAARRGEAARGGARRGASAARHVSVRPWDVGPPRRATAQRPACRPCRRLHAANHTRSRSRSENPPGARGCGPPQPLL